MGYYYGTKHPHDHDVLLLQMKIIQIIAGIGSLEHCRPLFFVWTSKNVHFNQFVHFSDSLELKTYPSQDAFNTRRDFHNHKKHGTDKH